MSIIKPMQEDHIYSRGYLPHWNVDGATLFLTWRLFDALDPEEWANWKAVYSGKEEQGILYRLAEARLDSHHGSAVLRPAHVGKVLMEAILGGHNHSYEVLAAVIMPTHVHAVLRIETGIELAQVVKGIKGSSGRAVNHLLGRTGRLWQPDYFDRLIRSPEHLQKCIDYVHWNPVKAKLCSDWTKYPNSTKSPYWAERLAGIAE